jgi:hypothetical protein
MENDRMALREGGCKCLNLARLVQDRPDVGSYEPIINFGPYKRQKIRWQAVQILTSPN